MMIRLPVVTAAIAILAFAFPQLHADTSDITENSPFYYTAGPGQTLPAGAAATTDSGIPHLPAYYGSFSTNNTHRFVNVNEQVVTMIGEGKHGLWRTHDNGTVREYITQAAENSNAGLSADSDIFDPANLDNITNNYSHLTEHANFGGYKADGNLVNAAGNLNYVDLPINHPKYAGRYDHHVPIDLPGWYCTMSGPEYPLARAAMRFTYAQDAANVVGPLGQRAGLDVRENYLNVIRLDLFPDARAWVNTMGNNSFDWQAVDASKTPFEIYMVERPFFNEEYLFIVMVFADKNPNNKNFSYVRPDGAYYEHLMARKAAGEKLPNFSTRLVHQPAFSVLGMNSKGKNAGKERPAGRGIPFNTNLYGVHHPGGKVIANGACPSMGGDFGAPYYGGSWPNTYQESTPLCDAVLVDIKLWANLTDKQWQDPATYLANATIDGAQNSGDQDGDGDPLTRGYTDDVTKPAANPGTYGVYSDPYLTNKGAVNPEQYTATGTQSKVFKTSQDAVTFNPPLPFTPSIP